VAYLIDGEKLVPYMTNFPDETFPTDATFEAFLVKFGLERRAVEVLAESVEDPLKLAFPKGNV